MKLLFAESSIKGSPLSVVSHPSRLSRSAFSYSLLWKRRLIWSQHDSPSCPSQLLSSSSTNHLVIPKFWKSQEAYWDQVSFPVLFETQITIHIWLLGGKGRERRVASAENPAGSLFGGGAYLVMLKAYSRLCTQWSPLVTIWGVRKWRGNTRQVPYLL